VKTAGKHAARQAQLQEEIDFLYQYIARVQIVMRNIAEGCVLQYCVVYITKLPLMVLTDFSSAARTQCESAPA